MITSSQDMLYSNRTDRHRAVILKINKHKTALTIENILDYTEIVFSFLHRRFDDLFMNSQEE